MPLGESHIILWLCYAMKQSPCVPLFVIIFLRVNRYGGQGKVFINIVLCPEVLASQMRTLRLQKLGV